MIAGKRQLLNTIRAGLLFLAIGTSSFVAAQAIQSSISLGDRSASANDSLSVPVQVYSNGGLVGLQFDVVYNGARIDISNLTPAELGTDHVFAVKEITDGLYRVIVYSTSNAEFENGIIANLEITTDSSFSGDRVNLSLANLSFVTSNGTTLSVDAAPFVQLTSPSGTIAANELEEVDLSAVAIALDGDITRVAFQVNGRTVGLDTDNPYAISWVVDVPGNVFLTAVAIDEDGNSGISPEVLVQVTPSPFIDAWRQTFFSEQQRADPAIVGLSADPDGDQISNFLELAFGSNPLNNDQSVVPKIEIIEEDGQKYLALRYQRPEEISDLIYTVEIYRDSEGWSSAPEEIEIEALSVFDGVEQFLAKSVDPISSASDLIRLRIELAP